jgi:hypothetical protein
MSGIRINQPNLERMFEVFELHAEEGFLIWKQLPSHRATNITLGARVGSNNTPNQARGYLRTMVDGERYLVHRLIWGMHFGRNTELQIDHQNGIIDDNRIDNLREATHGQNSMNRRLQRNNTCGLKGVTWHSKNRTWHAQIRVDGQRFGLGYHPTPEEAHAAYVAAARRLHGDFARVA